MAALNFPDPNVQTSYTNPDTGISYEWSNGIWKAIRTAQTAPELFVDVDGDNLTGNLTLGTDKIVLNATDGSATFAGYVESDLFSVSRSAVANKDNYSSKLSISDTGKHFNAKDTGGTTIASINADGSASFAGNVTLGSSPDAGAAEGVLIRKNGRIQLGSYQGSTEVWSGYTVGTSTPTSVINADGTATFAGYIECNRYSPNRIFLGDGTGGKQYGYYHTKGDGSLSVGIGLDGSATFAGKVETVGSSAAFHVGTDKDVSKVPFNIYDTADNNFSLVRIKGDGSATFAGDVVKGTYAPNNNYVALRDGQLEVGRNTNDGNLALITGTRFNGGTTYNVFSVKADGSATFAGTVTQNSSDRKFKENIADAPSQLDDVSALQLRTWDWNDLAPGNEDRNNRRRTGLVAQEAELIDSNLVYDVNEGEDAYKAIDHDVLIMKLLGAVKELSAKVAALEAN